MNEAAIQLNAVIINMYEAAINMGYAIKLNGASILCLQAIQLFVGKAEFKLKIHAGNNFCQNTVYLYYRNSHYSNMNCNK